MARITIHYTAPDGTQKATGFNAIDAIDEYNELGRIDIALSSGQLYRVYNSADEPILAIPGRRITLVTIDR